MKYNITFFFWICIFLGSCASPKSQTVSLPRAVALSADSLTIPPELLSVTRLFIAHDMLIAYEQRKDTLFSFWKLPECRYLFNAGIKGQGPNDFLMLDKTFVESKEGFKAFELPSNRIKEIKIDSKGTFKLFSDQRLKTDQMSLNRFLFLADSSYCFLSQDDEYEFTLLDKKSNVRSFSHYPLDLLEKKEGESNQFVFNKLTIAKPDGEKFAAFYVNIKMLRIYDRQGKMLKEVLLEEPESSSDNGKKIAYYSYQPCADEQHIYALTEQGKQRVLEVWTWEGDLKARYSLDKKISAFAVSDKYHTLYAIDKNIENVVYTYKMKDMKSSNIKTL